jgi:hypothetical protein
MNRSRLHVSLLFLLATLPGLAQERVQLETVTLEPKLLGATCSRLQLSIGEHDGLGFMELDPNLARLGPFGDRTTTTRMGSARKAVTLERIAEEDPTGAGRRLYRISGDAVPAGVDLVVPPHRGLAYRLCVRDGDSRRVVTLEPVRAPTQAPPRADPRNPAPQEGDQQRPTGWVPGRATYGARRVQGSVVVTARGEHPTGGFGQRLHFVRRADGALEVAFLVRPPDGPATQVLTPFELETHFEADSQIRRVSVVDREGRHDLELKDGALIPIRPPVKDPPPSGQGSVRYTGTSNHLDFLEALHGALRQAWAPESGGGKPFTYRVVTMSGQVGEGGLNPVLRVDIDVER